MHEMKVFAVSRIIFSLNSIKVMTFVRKNAISLHTERAILFWPKFIPFTPSYLFYVDSARYPICTMIHTKKRPGLRLIFSYLVYLKYAHGIRYPYMEIFDE